MACPGLLFFGGVVRVIDEPAPLTALEVFEDVVVQITDQELSLDQRMNVQAILQVETFNQFEVATGVTLNHFITLMNNYSDDNPDDLLRQLVFAQQEMIDAARDANSDEEDDFCSLILLQDIQGNYLSHIAARENCSMDLLEYFLDNGLELTDQNQAGQTPIDVAREVGHEHLAQEMQDFQDHMSRLRIAANPF